jgi:hypothetical protein
MQCLTDRSSSVIGFRGFLFQQLQRVLGAFVAIVRGDLPQVGLSV